MKKRSLYMLVLLLVLAISVTGCIGTGNPVDKAAELAEVNEFVEDVKQLIEARDSATFVALLADPITLITDSDELRLLEELVEDAILYGLSFEEGDEDSVDEEFLQFAFMMWYILEEVEFFAERGWELWAEYDENGITAEFEELLSDVTQDLVLAIFILPLAENIEEDEEAINQLFSEISNMQVTNQGIEMPKYLVEPMVADLPEVSEWLESPAPAVIGAGRYEVCLTMDIQGLEENVVFTVQKKSGSWVIDGIGFEL